MKSIDRYQKYKEEDFDTIILKIRSGEIKSGRYSRLVKIDKNKKFSDNRKEYFNGSENSKSK